MRALSFFLLLSVLAPAALAQPGAGRVERHVEVVHYTVEGTTAAELAASMRARGPATDGQPFFGRTAWRLSAEYLWVQRDTGCRAENVVVRVATTITLPRWDPPRGADPGLVQAWGQFVRALEAHEREHQRLVEEGAEAVRRELATMRLASCASAEARARASVARIVDDVNARNRRYDERTEHGAREGAVWPPRGR